MFKTLLKILVFHGIYLLVLVLFRLPSPAISQEVAAWTNMGLYGGQILDIAIDPDNADKIFAGAYMGDGLYVTENGGQSWKAVTGHSPPQNHESETPNSLISLNPTQNKERGSKRLPENMFKNRAVSAVKIAPSNSDIIWVAHNCRVEKSTDGGKSWTHVAQDVIQFNCQDCRRVDDGHRSCISLAIDPLDAQTVYMGTTGPNQGYYAIYKTKDGGNTWTNTNQENYFDCRVVDINIDPRNTNIIWAVTSPMGGRSSCPGRLYRSGDRGEPWKNIMTLQLGFTTVVVNPKDSNSVFTGSYSHKDSGIKEHYFDGEQWLCRSPYIPIDGGYSVVLDISFAPQDSHILYATWKNIKPGDTFSDVSGKVSRSVDGGKDWETYTVDYEFSSLAVHPADSGVIFGGERYLGIYKSNDYGQSWYAANNGISSVIVYDVAIDPNDSARILAGTMSGVYKRNPDKTWSRLLHQETYSLEFHPKYSHIFYAGLSGHLAETKDGGDTWTYSKHLKNSSVNDITIDPDSENGGALFSEKLVAENQYGASYDFNVVTLDPSDPRHLFAGGGNFYYPGTPGDLLNGSRVNDITIDPDNDTVYIAVSRGSDYLGRIYKSENGGASFFEVLVAKNQYGASYDFNVVTLDPFDPQHLFAGGGDFYGPKVPGDLWESTDGGKEWSLTGLKNKIVNALLINPENPEIMYAGCGHSTSAEVPLYKSTDGGKNWRASFKGIPGKEPNFLNNHSRTRFVMKDSGTFNRAVTDLEFHRKDKNVIYASTYGAGVYISPKQAENWLNLGTPKHNVRAIATSSVYAATDGELSDCTGTGLIEGRVEDVKSGDCINLAEVENSMGGWGLNICLEDFGLCGDYYWMVARACESALTATATGYEMAVPPVTVTVYGGGVTQADVLYMHKK